MKSRGFCVAAPFVAPLLLVLSIGAPHAEAAKLTGPVRATPGKHATFRAVGFPPNAEVSVLLNWIFNGRSFGEPRIALGGGAGTSTAIPGVALKQSFTTNGAGNAALRFRWPLRFWASFDQAGNAPSDRWRRGDRFRVLATATSTGVSAWQYGRIGRNRSAPKPLAIPATAGKAIFRAVCPPGERCTAKVTIDAGKKTLARGGYSVPAGKSRKVHLGLTAAGRRKLSGSNRVKAKATIADTRTGKRKSFPVILRRRK